MSVRKCIGFTLAALALALAVFRIWLLPDLLVRQISVPAPPPERTPADVGLAYEDASFEVDGDRLVAWYVRPPDPAPIAFLLFHGDGESVADFIGVQKLLHDRGYASLVYDYAGYGASEGNSSTRRFDEEPKRALQVLLERSDPQTRVSVIGHSMGATVAVDGLHDAGEPRLHSLVFNAGPSSLRDMMHDVIGVPRVITALVPNVVNARGRIGAFDVPVLVIINEDDRVVPPAMTRRVFEAAGEPKELMVLADSGHNELIAAIPDWWAPILEWVAAR